MKNLLISQRILLNKHGVKIDTLENDYTRYFNKLGYNLIPISNFINNPDEFINRLDFTGIILSGGGSINPGYLLKKLSANQLSKYNFFSEREGMENKLIKVGLKKDIPILGICRGMQQLNAFFGGKLIKDYNYCGKRVPGEAHLIRINNLEVLGLEKGNFKHSVNHYHNDVITKDILADEFKIVAVDDKFETIEGIVHAKKPILGIQWHPERFERSDELTNQIIRNFLGGVNN